MGQIFNAVAYDLDSMTCFVDDADKFHANCYNFSPTVRCIHYLLRQKPYRVMWGGDYFIPKNKDLNFSEEFLFGIS